MIRTPKTNALMLRWSLKEGARNSTCSEEAHEIYALAEYLEERLAALEADARRKEKALRELVACKDLKDSLIVDYVVNGEPVYVDGVKHSEYKRRKDAAWVDARAALSQEPGGK